MSLSISMKVKTALVGAAVIAGVGLAGPAFAQVINDGTTGDGDLFLMIYDSTAKVSYVEDLGITTAAVATDSQVATAIAGATGGTLSSALTYSASFSADTTLSGWLSGHTGDSYVWEVLANTSPTSASQTVLLSTSASPVAKTFTGSAGSGMSNGNAISNAGNLQGAIDGMAGDGIFALNGGIGGPNANSSSTNPNLTSDANAIGQSAGQGLLTWYNTGNMTPVNSFKPSGGSSVSNFYLIGANSANGNPVADIFDLGTVTLAANGTLTFAAAAPSVPLPAALWLFGSGLLGLAGVARRRAA